MELFDDQWESNIEELITVALKQKLHNRKTTPGYYKTELLGQNANPSIKAKSSNHSCKTAA